MRPALKVSTKRLKVTIAILHGTNKYFIIYLGINLIGQTMDEILVSRSTLIFLLKDFLTITKKPVLKPIHQIEFLGLLIDMNIMPLSLT